MAMEIIAVDGNDKYNIIFIANTEQYSSTLPIAQKIVDSIKITPQDSQSSIASNINPNSNNPSDRLPELNTGKTGTDEAQNRGLQGFSVADETAKIKAKEYQFYNFEINPDISTAQLTGTYKEKGGNDVILTLYETSSCNAPATSSDFDITTCKEIYSDTSSSGNIQVQLSPGKYYLTLSSADQLHDLKVVVHFDVSSG